jgi:uncharacterized protein (DUF952 family)
MAIAAAALCLASQSVYCNQVSNQKETMESTPQYLYKILSAEDWKKSQDLNSVILSSADADFIHFSKEDQVDRIVSKYWSQNSSYVILKVEAAKLPGKMIFEANPGGASKYYHLYDGSIPLNAIAEWKLFSR